MGLVEAGQYQKGDGLGKNPCGTGHSGYIIMNEFLRGGLVQQIKSFMSWKALFHAGVEGYEGEDGGPLRPILNIINICI